MIKFRHDIDWYQKVYLVADSEQMPWLVTGINLTPNGIMFNLSRMGEAIDVFEGEFTIHEDVEAKLGLTGH